MLTQGTRMHCIIFVAPRTTGVSVSQNDKAALIYWSVLTHRRQPGGDPRGNEGDTTPLFVKWLVNLSPHPEWLIDRPQHRSRPRHHCFAPINYWQLLQFNGGVLCDQCSFFNLYRPGRPQITGICFKSSYVMLLTQSNQYILVSVAVCSWKAVLKVCLFASPRWKCLAFRNAHDGCLSVFLPGDWSPAAVTNHTHTLCWQKASLVSVAIKTWPKQNTHNVRRIRWIRACARALY